MAINIDIFGSALSGERKAREDNWDDLNQYENIEQKRTTNDASNLDLLADINDFYGQRQKFQDEVLNSGLKTGLAQQDYVIDSLGNIVKTNTASAKAAVSDSRRPEELAYLTNTWDANVAQGNYAANMLKGVTGVNEEYAPIQLADYGAGLGVQSQLTRYQHANALPNAQVNQGLFTSGAIANNAAYNTSALASQSQGRLIPLQEETTTAALNLQQGNSNAAASLLPAQTAYTQKQYEVGGNTLDRQDAIGAATAPVAIQQASNSLIDLQTRPQQVIDNQRQLLIGNLSMVRDTIQKQTTLIQRLLEQGIPPTDPRITTAQSTIQAQRLQEQNISTQLGSMGVDLMAPAPAPAPVVAPVPGVATVDNPLAVVPAPVAPVAVVPTQPSTVVAPTMAVIPRPPAESVEWARNVFATWTRPPEPRIENSTAEGQAKFIQDKKQYNKALQTKEQARAILQAAGLIQ